MSAISAELRVQVVERAADRCEYCRLPQCYQVATYPVDHVIPVVEEGPTELANLCLACPRCNARKWLHTQAVDPDTGERIAIFNPRTERWEDHFRWSATDPRVLEGLTSCGRATIALLDLNASRHLLIRQWLVQIGQHPPE